MEPTKGPYTIVEHSWAVTSIYANEKRICVLDMEDDATEETQKELEKQQRANALMLCAAREMMEALSDVLDTLQNAPPIDLAKRLSETYKKCLAAYASAHVGAA